ncbi:MAG: hypothetical protein NVSMB52_07380 [Chloroflexota bacterium]
MPSLRLRPPPLATAAFAGSLAATAYLVEQALDRRLLPNAYDDLLLWGGLLSRNPRRQKLLGLTAHYVLGILLAAAYGALLPTMPKAPGWVRGLIFVQIENSVLYPGVPVLNAIHPDVGTGTLPSLWTWRFFWVEVLRHAAFGAVLGALTPDDSVRSKAT